MRIVPLALLSIVLAGAAGCAGRTAPAMRAAPLPSPGPSNAGPSPSRSDNLVPDGYTGRFRVTAVVLENEKHGPQLCLGLVDLLMGAPPDCRGLPLSNWTWHGLHPRTDGETTSGTYVVIGKSDGRVFTLTEPAKPGNARVDPMPGRSDYTSPCPVPAGGWKPVDPAKATDSTFEAVMVMVRHDPDFAGLWLDQKNTPSVDPNRGGVHMNDPANLVLDIRFTKDLARHEADIRKVYGGAICLSRATYSWRQLFRAESQLVPGPGVIFSGLDDVTSTVQLHVWLATRSRQHQLDVKYGPGLVHLIGALEPIDR